jgi:hypothetical protein
VSHAREILLRTARPSPTGLSASKVVAMRTQAHGKRRIRAGSGRKAASREKRGIMYDDGEDAMKMTATIKVVNSGG